MGDLLGSPLVAPLFFVASTVYFLRCFLLRSIRAQRIQHGGVVLLPFGIKRSVCRSGGSCRRRPICIKSYSFLNGNGPMSKTRRYATTRGAFRPNSNVWASKRAFFALAEICGSCRYSIYETRNATRYAAPRLSSYAILACAFFFAVFLSPRRNSIFARSPAFLVRRNAHFRSNRQP